jgi:hypothetical protein
MYDAIYVANLPGGDVAYGAYVGGRWPTYNAVRVAFPHARVLSIAVNASQDADCLDIETGDATVDEAPAWVRRQQARGVGRPVLYTSQTNLGALMGALAAGGVGRTEVRLWSAHYAGKHICSPVCGAPVQCDGTQWIDHDDKYDESLLADDFFTSTVGDDMALTEAEWGRMAQVIAQVTGQVSVTQGYAGAADPNHMFTGMAAQLQQLVDARLAVALDPAKLAAAIAPQLNQQAHVADQAAIETAIRNVFAELGKPTSTPGA